MQFQRPEQIVSMDISHSMCNASGLQTGGRCELHESIVAQRREARGTWSYVTQSDHICFNQMGLRDEGALQPLSPASCLGLMPTSAIGWECFGGRQGGYGVESNLARMDLTSRVRARA